MSAALPLSLLADDEPAPVEIRHPAGTSPFFITCDHAGRLIPRSLGVLGLPESELVRHIAWDIGIAEVSRRMADALDATLVAQLYSRLVIDCNRDPGVASSICEISELTHVPGNLSLAAEHRRERHDRLFVPYHDAITRALDERRDAKLETVLVAMHSFTPVYKGYERPWHAGLLYNRDDRYSRIVLDILRAEPGLVVGDNEPYSVSDASDYTIPVHGERRGLPHVAIEIRQDLIEAEAGQREWADRMVRVLTHARQRFQAEHG